MKCGNDAVGGIYNWRMRGECSHGLRAARALAEWQKREGRRNLPWQKGRDPYKIWLSEVMLQQTRAAAVVPYYRNFLARFPTVAALARAEEDEVMAQWSGLGYYRRAANLHRSAKLVAARGAFPRDWEALRALPGVGKSTAGAIAVFAFGERRAILDANAKRVLARLFAVGGAADSAAGERVLWRIAESVLPPREIIRPYTQGLMDLGATVCLRANPHCNRCPLAKYCRAHKTGAENEYPKKLPRKNKPSRQTAMALIVCGEKTLLQKREGKGVWRGLWSLPENADAETLRKQWRKLLPGLRKMPRRLILRHEFTHYKLTAEVLIFRAKQQPPGDWRWTAQKDLPQTALPSPIRKLLAADNGKGNAI